VFAACLETMPRLTLNLAQTLASRRRLASAQIQALATQDVGGRVARQLLAFADAYGRETEPGAILIPLRLTQSDLASLVGASRVRVNQVLAQFQRRHYLAVHPNHHLILHNRAALAHYCHYSDAAVPELTARLSSR
jgi:CRP/FNR family cyclic AMP-dependent transcriptional regulator